MKDQLEQLYISACIGQWDSATFAEKAMELIEPNGLKLDLDIPL